MQSPHANITVRLGTERDNIDISTLFPAAKSKTEKSAQVREKEPA